MDKKGEKELLQEIEILKKQIEKLKERKKYGLVWDAEKEPEKVVLDCKKKLPILIEDKSKEIKGGENEPVNLLIEGDNYHSLSVLNYTHKENIDIIYIDPPYNTGNKDFIYNDHYIDKDDSYRHSKWLNFMEKRLSLSKKLLKDNGIIFVSIGDDELAQLKLLCDEIFGENNYINVISINTKNNAGASGGGEDTRLKKNIEYVLVYCKNYNSIILNNIYEYLELSVLLEKYKNEEVSWKYNSVLMNAGKKEYITSTVDGDGNEIKIYKRVNPLIKSIKQYALEMNISEKEVYDKHFDKIFRTTMPQSSIRPRVMKKMNEINREEDLISIEYIPKTGRNKGILYEQFYTGKKYNLFAWLRDVCIKKDDVVYKKELKGTLWDLVGETKNLSKEGNMQFDNGKKPIKLMKQLISLHPNKSALILDFFAGSGSTGHAVLDLNKEDVGNRRFILCTDNENNICEKITYVRLKNNIKGYKYNDKSVKGLGGSLKYYKTNFVETENLDNATDKDKIELTYRAGEMIAIREDTFEEVEKNDWWQIFSNKNEITAIYFKEDKSKLQKLVDKLDKMDKKINLYIFSWGKNEYVNEFVEYKNIKVKDIPEPLIEVYKEVANL